MKKGLLLILFIIVTYGCSFMPAPALKEYALLDKTKPIKLRKTVSVKVEPFNCPQRFKTLSIYQRSGMRFIEYPNVSWMESPCDAFGRILKNGLEKSGFDVKDYGKVDLILNYTLKDFEIVKCNKQKFALACVYVEIKSREKKMFFDVCKKIFSRGYSIESDIKSLNRDLNFIVESTIKQLVKVK